MTPEEELAKINAELELEQVNSELAEIETPPSPFHSIRSSVLEVADDIGGKPVLKNPDGSAKLTVGDLGKEAAGFAVQALASKGAGSVARLAPAILKRPFLQFLLTGGLQTAGDIAGEELNQALQLHEGTPGGVDSSDLVGGVVSAATNYLLPGIARKLSKSQVAAEQSGAIAAELGFPRSSSGAERVLAKELIETEDFIQNSGLMRGGNFNPQTKVFENGASQPLPLAVVRDNIDRQLPVMVEAKQDALNAIDEAVVAHNTFAKEPIRGVSFDDVKPEMEAVFDEMRRLQKSEITSDAARGIGELLGSVENDLRNIVGKFGQVDPVVDKDALRRFAKGSGEVTEKELKQLFKGAQFGEASPAQVDELIQNIDFKLKELRAFDATTQGRALVDESAFLKNDRAVAVLSKFRTALANARDANIASSLSALSKSTDPRILELIGEIKPETVINLNEGIHRSIITREAIERRIGDISQAMAADASSALGTKVGNIPTSVKGGVVDAVASVARPPLAELEQTIATNIDDIIQRRFGESKISRLLRDRTTQANVPTTLAVGRTALEIAKEAKEQIKSIQMVPNAEAVTTADGEMADALSMHILHRQGLISSEELRKGIGASTALSEEAATRAVTEARSMIMALDTAARQYGEESPQFENQLATFTKEVPGFFKGLKTKIPGEIKNAKGEHVFPLIEDRLTYSGFLRDSADYTADQKAVMRSAVHKTGRIISAPRKIKPRSTLPEAGEAEQNAASGE